MGRFRNLRRFLVALLLTVCSVLLLVFAAGQIGQHLLRRRAELLLSEIQSLELRKTPWPRAQQQFQHWGANRQFDNHCDEQKCFLQITLNDFVSDFISRTNIFIRLDDYFRWRFKLSYNMGPFARLQQDLFSAYVRAGGHPARLMASIGMRDGIVWSKGFFVMVETYSHDSALSGGWEIEYALMADASSVSRLGHQSFYSADPQLILHPYYEIGRPGGCTICIAGWAHFTPYADPADVHRLMQFDLSCLTRWRHPCLTQGDIMPAAWTQYLAESARPDKPSSQPGCSSSVLESLGRDAFNIITAEILRYRESVDGRGYHDSTASIRVLERLRGAADWKPGEIRKISIHSDLTAEDRALRAGSRLVLFFRNKFQVEYQIEVLTSPGYGCPSVPATKSNLELVRRGIAQDYSVTDKDE
ncbi:MAG: hypothetical protein LAN71_02315 [Acidobacteriia bacterium]|nr:hypothetical protein [Terriglobia bacterium]